MLSRIKNRELRFRIIRACFLGALGLVEEYAVLYGVPVVRASPKDTSKLYPPPTAN